MSWKATIIRLGFGSWFRKGKKKKNGGKEAGEKEIKGKGRVHGGGWELERDMKSGEMWCFLEVWKINI